MANPIIETQSLTKIFKSPNGEHVAIKDLSLKIETNKITLITGLSGCGKSTLLYLLSTLLSPSEGKIFLGKEDMTSWSETQKANWRHKNAGFIFQDYQLLPNFTVLENIKIAAKHSLNKKSNQAEQLLKELDLDSKKDAYPPTLSGGEAQRAAIARALIKTPKILFCDEPTGNLDDTNATRFTTLLKAQQKKSPKTILIVTHDTRLYPLADTIIQLKKD